ncbi:hypothetical protein [Halobacillus massiliensis]|uniref:hypothetical protein n=1 Tax=Halobacillus massiliensis TaxID=1926286 RepID=UPI0015C46BE2|nr:hypothetical protein [Halobacillus massiliensis]
MVADFIAGVLILVLLIVAYLIAALLGNCEQKAAIAAALRRVYSSLRASCTR